jgi:hypothetical protein
MLIPYCNLAAAVMGPMWRLTMTVRPLQCPWMLVKSRRCWNRSSPWNVAVAMTLLGKPDSRCDTGCGGARPSRRGGGAAVWRSLWGDRVQGGHAVEAVGYGSPDYSSVWFNDLFICCGLEVQWYYCKDILISDTEITWVLFSPQDNYSCQYTIE